MLYLKIYSTFFSILLLSIMIFIIVSYTNSATPVDKNSHTAIASRFHLTDLSLSTESRHTRHLSQPELIAPFQDAPGYLDHFPSSTFISASNLNSFFLQSDSIQNQVRGDR
ncbi:MAG: hypothetical protein JW956_13335 [Calditrichaceae bacterium]|nr:hypothetical protein [Calditrichaceae bacterium]